jgi:hypothetical protein
VGPSLRDVAVLVVHCARVELDSALWPFREAQHRPLAALCPVGHTLQVSEFADGAYSRGVSCDVCGKQHPAVGHPRFFCGSCYNVSRVPIAGLQRLLLLACCVIVQGIEEELEVENPSTVPCYNVKRAIPLPTQPCSHRSCGSPPIVVADAAVHRILMLLWSPA